MQDLTEVLFQRVYLPEFVKAAQARGVPVQSEDDVAELLKIAVNLRVHAAAAAQEAQQGSHGLLKEAANRLEMLTSGQAPADDGRQYLQDPELVKAFGSADSK